MSIVVSVEHELNTLESELINGISPLIADGSNRVTSNGYALSPVTSVGSSAFAISPGSTRINIGKIFSAAQNRVP